MESAAANEDEIKNGATAHSIIHIELARSKKFWPHGSSALVKDFSKGVRAKTQFDADQVALRGELSPGSKRRERGY